MTQTQRLLALYDAFPFHRHPLWLAVLSHSLSREQVVRAEIQHWLRTKAGQKIRLQAVTEAQSQSPAILDAVFDTYIEECVTRPGNVSHLELIERLVRFGGATDKDLEQASATPGNAAAIALYKDIGSRAAACHIIGAGAVEQFYAELSPKIFSAYVETYGFSPDSAETYRIHGPMDQEHATRALSIVDEAVSNYGWKLIEDSVRDAFVATSLHYDGMLQAATGLIEYWSGGRP